MEIWRKFMNFMDIYCYNMGIRMTFYDFTALLRNYGGFLWKYSGILTIKWIFTVIIWEYEGVLTFLRLLSWKYGRFKSVIRF
jgi:hypothetical protein